MINLNELKKIAVLIDAENAQYSKTKAILDEISAHGHIIVKRAYGDWSKEGLKNWRAVLNELAIQPEQQFSYTSGKNSSDGKMIIDAMDLLYTGKFDAFVLVTSDSDFTSLATRLKQSEIFVFGVGESKTPVSFRNACDDFILTENLGRAPRTVAPEKRAAASTASSSPETASPAASSPAAKRVARRPSAVRERPSAVPASAPAAAEPEAKESDLSLASVIELLHKAWEVHLDEESEFANVASAGHYIKRMKPDFDVRTYGYAKLPALIASMPDRFDMVRTRKGSATIVAYKPKEA